MANNPVVNSITFSGSVAGQASLQSQGIAGNLTFLLPNTPPTVGQLLTATSINGNNVFFGWSASQSSPSFSQITGQLALNQIAQGGAGTNQILEWNGSTWAPASAVPGAGTVTSFSAGTLAPLFTTSVATGTTTPALSFILTNAGQNTVFAGPATGGTGAPSYRALVVADLPTISFANITGSISTGQIPASTITLAQINSKQGVGNAVQTTNTGATVAGDIAIYSDTAGTLADSTTLLSSLAT